MARTRLKPLPGVLIMFVVIGLVILTNYLMKSPKATIKRILRNAGFSSENVKYWIAVSAFETANFTSDVFKDGKNLFGVRYESWPIHLAYGEGQNVYDTFDASVNDLIHAVINPFSYSKNYASLPDLVHAMKSKGYFTSNEGTYLAGVQEYYDKFFL